MERIEHISRSASETWDIGERIGRAAKRGEVYAVYGELGAGKTQLVKGIAKGMGVRDWLYVVSPSFTIMNVYEGRGANLCHMDLYRLDSGQSELLSVEDFLDEGVVVVEWAERANWWEGIVRIFVDVLGEEERKITLLRE
jgi:tRNA threonylcarbamoyladenosine biosynthesis protein TsaE